MKTIFNKENCHVTQIGRDPANVFELNGATSKSKFEFLQV
jgi:hypothetical protein